MTIKKNEKRLLIVLGVVVLVFLFDQVILSSGDKESAPANKAFKEAGTQLVKSVNTMGKGAGTTAIAAIPPPEKKQFDDWGRDPFQSTRTSTIGQMLSGDVKKKKEIKKPELQGFFWKGEKVFVLVDNVILTEGDEKEGIRVDRIQDKEVLCSKGGKTFTLFWRESP